DPGVLSELKQHAETCLDCRALLEIRQKLDSWEAPEVSANFDSRLYARIAEEKTHVPWWRRMLWPPVIPLAAASAALALTLFVHVPQPADSVKQVVDNSEIEQVEQALEDLDLLMPLNVASANKM